MTELEQIKASASEAYSNTNYSLAFQTLWRAGVSVFIRYAENEEVKDENWFVSPQSSEFFWNSFIFSEEVFNALIGSDFAEHILHTYFSKSEAFAQAFETRLAKEHPIKFVHAIRVNQTYLKAERINSLCAAQLPNELALHQKFWRRIHEAEQAFWRRVQTGLTEVSKESLPDIFSKMIIWLETTRFYDGSKETLHHLATVYSFAAELLLCEYPKKVTETLTEEIFAARLFNIIMSLEKGQAEIGNSSVGKLLFDISQWVHYREQVISPYSFDLDIEPRQENELLLFNVTPESRYNWRLNGVRYEVNQLHYFLSGLEFVGFLEEANQQIIPGKTEAEIEANRKMAALKWSTFILLRDMGITTFKTNQGEVSVEKLLAPLLAFSYNRMTRYELSLAKHSQHSQNWLEAIRKVSIEAVKTDIRREPFLLMSKKQFKELNKEAIGHLTEESAEDVANIASYKVDASFAFDRFRSRYDVFQKPFLKVGAHLFCPTMFFGSNLWFYSFAQEGLTRYKTKKTERDETRTMEEFFAETIREKGWFVTVVDDKMAGKIKNGDVDIFVEDNDTLVFIQLKRTYFRLSLKQAYYESLNSDKTAARQLNKAEIFLSQDNPVYTVTKKPVKWITSTSFEKIGENIEGCKKVNYFEILNALKNPEIKSVRDLVEDVERDRNIKKLAMSAINIELPEDVRLYALSTGLPLPMLDLKEYRQSIFTEDESRTKEYNDLFHRAIALDDNGQKNEAFVLLQRCIHLNPYDAEAYGALANILADVHSFENAFSTFKKALELAPNDPYISRNYSIALLQAGRYYESLRVALNNYEKFPLLGDLRPLFEDHFVQCIQQGLLNEAQIIELQAKWSFLT